MNAALGKLLASAAFMHHDNKINGHNALKHRAALKRLTVHCYKTVCVFVSTVCFCGVHGSGDTTSNQHADCHDGQHLRRHQPGRKRVAETSKYSLIFGSNFSLCIAFFNTSVTMFCDPTCNDIHKNMQGLNKVYFTHIALTSFIEIRISALFVIYHRPWSKV